MVEIRGGRRAGGGGDRGRPRPRVERIVICTPDKDLAQCVRGTRIVQMDRRRRTIRDEAGVVEKFGVPPASIPDYLALVGDAADGYPGLPDGARDRRRRLRGSGTRVDSRDWREWTGGQRRPAGALATRWMQQRDRAS